MSVVVQTDKTVVVHAPSGTVLVAQVLGGSSNTSGGMQASVYDPQEISGDAFDRGNHTGTQPMSSIGDKQGKTLDDLIVIEDYDAEIDDLKTPGGYIVAPDFGVNGYQVLSEVIVGIAESKGVVGVVQKVSSPLLQTVSWRMHDGAAWGEWGSSISSGAIEAWHYDTTAEAANAVINADGTFSRSIATYNPNPILVVSGASHAFLKADVNKYARYTDAGAKTATFDSSEGFTAGDAFHITNRAASGDITISGTGVTFNAPKGGTLVLEPKDTVTVKFVSPTEADVMGSTRVAA